MSPHSTTAAKVVIFASDPVTYDPVSLHPEEEDIVPLLAPWPQDKGARPCINELVTQHPAEEERQQVEELEMGRDEQYLKPEARSGDEVLLYLAMSSLVIILLAAWSLIIFNLSSGFGWFAYHPPLQTLALACFTYGIITLQPTAQPKTKVAGLRRHQATILFLGIPSIIMGTSAISYNKSLRGGDHFTTWHGKLGILCISWMAIQALVGGGSVWFGGATFGGGAKAKSIWKYHRMSGYLLFPALLFTTHLGGVWSHWAEAYGNVFVHTVAFTLAPIVLLAAVWGRARLSKMGFTK